MGVQGNGGTSGVGRKVSTRVEAEVKPRAGQGPLSGPPPPESVGGDVGAVRGSRGRGVGCEWTRQKAIPRPLPPAGPRPTRAPG